MKRCDFCDYPVSETFSLGIGDMANDIQICSLCRNCLPFNVMVDPKSVTPVDMIRAMMFAFNKMCDKRGIKVNTSCRKKGQ